MFRTIKMRLERTPALVQTVAVFNPDADLNASRNVAAFSRRVGGRLSVCEPNAADDEAEGRKAVEAEFSCKPKSSIVGG